ncbi:MAG: hypothetical protein PWQ10_39 [Patescibacteria group bacterium]|nr:hypothetical protein [Patescibacteria group bacterium]
MIIKSIKDFFKYLKPIKLLNVGFDSGSTHKPVIVMLHGIGATHKTWDVLIKEFDVKEYRLIAIDLLGFGKSPMPINCEYNVDDHVRYLRKTIKSLEVNRQFTLVGHSMGSIIAARYCHLYPKSINRVYMLSLPLYLKNIKGTNFFSNKQTDLYLNAYKLISKKKDFAIKYSKRLRNILRINDGLNVDERTWHSFSLSLKNTIIKQNTYNDIKSIKLPIYIIYGMLDEFLVQDNIKQLKHFDNIKITRLVGVNHSIGAKFAKYVANQIIVSTDNEIIPTKEQ